MNQSSQANYTHLLREMMQQVGVSSFKALGQKAGVSDWQVKQLRQGQVARMRVEVLHQFSQVLQVPMGQLIETFSTLTGVSSSPTELLSSTRPEMSAESDRTQELQQEYERLQTQLTQQREVLWQEFQQSALQTLESWLLQWPTAVYAAQQNSDIPARRLLPLLHPVEQLLAAWGVSAIAPVGTELPYDPQLHQLMNGIAQPGDQVRVRYTGYRQSGKLLYRAKVSPVDAG